MKSAYQIIRRPVITEKGLAIKENQNTLVFQVAPGATKTEVKQAVQSIFKVKVCGRRCIPEKSGVGESLPATVLTGRRRMCGCGPARRCQSTRRICKADSPGKERRSGMTRKLQRKI